MPEHKKKLDIFSDVILGEANVQAQLIIDDLTKKRDEAVAAAELRFAKEAERYRNAKIAEIKARERSRISAKIVENRRALLQYRESCANEVQELVLRRIEEFTNSSGYPEYLVSLLKKAVDYVGKGFSAEVRLRSEDLIYADMLSGSVSGVTLIFRDGYFALGGLRLVCTAIGKRVDLSFDSAMAELFSRFSELTEMHV